jgi:hypothetical protein
MLGFAPISSSALGSLRVDDSFTNASATVACAVSVSASGERIQNGAATITCAASVSAAGEIMQVYIEGAATITCAASVSASAVTYNTATGFRAGYGQGLYGTFVYGVNQSVENAAATIACVSAASASGDVTREASATITCAASVSASAVSDVVGSATIVSASVFTASAGATIQVNLAAASAVSTMTAISEIKWTEASAVSTTWTEAAAANTNWTKSDLLERAA